MSNFSIKSDKNIVLDSKSIIVSCTTLDFQCNIFPTLSFTTTSTDVSNFSNFSNISSIAINFSKTLINEFNVSMESFGQNIVLSRDGSTIAIGSPYYNFNAGRVDIYNNASLVNTYIGDAPNSYFGQNLVISDNGSTVLMGSPAYRSGRGIFNQYYNGSLNISLIGDSNMSYGQNILLDQTGNTIMYTDAVVPINASTTTWTYYNFSYPSVTANSYNSSKNGIIYQNNFSNFGITALQNIITMGNPNSYLLNTTNNNTSLLLINSSFIPISNGWPLTNVKTTYTVRVNNDTYFAVIYMLYKNVTIYVGNFTSTDQIGKIIFTIDTVGPIVANLNSLNILTLQLPNGTIKVYTIEPNNIRELNTYQGTLTALSANASVIAVGNSSNIKVFDIKNGTTILEQPGQVHNIAINASGTVVAARSTSGIVNIYKNNMPYVNIVGPNGYGNQIALNASGTVFAITNTDVVQVFTNLNNLSNVSGNISTNTSTTLTNSSTVAYNTNIIYCNKVNVMNTSYTTVTVTNISNVSNYKYDVFTGQMSFVSSSQLQYSSTTTSDVVLNIGLDPSISQINMGNVVANNISSKNTNTESLNVSNVSTNFIKAANAEITSANASNVSTNFLQSNNATIMNATIINVNSSQITTNNISVNNLSLSGSLYMPNNTYTTITNTITSMNSSILTKNYNLSSLNGFNLSSSANSLYGKNIALSSDGSVIVVGSPNFSSNAGRIDIYKNSSLLNTVIGDNVNSYFGTNIVVSDNGSSVLMGSQFYQGGRGIFNQFYNGQLNFSVVGPATNMSYGANIYFDFSGNAIMYSNASVTSWSHYTLFGVSPTANMSLVANMSTSVYNATTISATNWFSQGYRTFVWFSAINIFTQISGRPYRNHAFVAKDTTPRPCVLNGAGYYNATPFNVFSCFSSSNAVLPIVEPVGAGTNNFNYVSVVHTTAQPGFIFTEVINNNTLNISYYVSTSNNYGEIGTIIYIGYTLPKNIDNAGIQMYINSKNILIVYIPSSNLFSIFSVITNNPIVTNIPPINTRLYLSTSFVSIPATISLAANASVFAVGQPNNGNGIVQAYSILNTDPAIILKAANWNTSYGTNVALNASGTVLATSSPYNNGIIDIYQNIDPKAYLNPVSFSVPNITSNFSVNASYGQSIALNASGTIFATATPYYNSSSGLVQIYNLSTIYTNTSIVTTNTSTYNYTTNALYIQGLNVMNTSSLNTFINTSTSNISITYQNALVNSSFISNINTPISTTSGTGTTILNIGNDPSISTVNMNNVNITNLNVSNLYTNYIITPSIYTPGTPILTNMTNGNSQLSNMSFTSFLSLYNVSNISSTPNSFFGENIAISYSANGSVLAIGSPNFSSNAGRLDIYKNSSLINTVIGDAPNSYFGNKILVSPDSRTVLMSSEYYQGGCGIFNQYYDGILNFSVIGASTNMSYGQNMYFDCSGNSIMYTNASITNATQYTIFGISPNATQTYVANVFNYSLNNGTLFPTNYATNGVSSVIPVFKNVFNSTDYHNYSFILKFVDPINNVGTPLLNTYYPNRIAIYGAATLSNFVYSSVTFLQTSSYNSLSFKLVSDYMIYYYVGDYESVTSVWVGGIKGTTSNGDPQYIICNKGSFIPSMFPQVFVNNLNTLFVYGIDKVYLTAISFPNNVTNMTPFKGFSYATLPVLTTTLGQGVLAVASNANRFALGFPNLGINKGGVQCFDVTGATNAITTTTILSESYEVINSYYGSNLALNPSGTILVTSSPYVNGMIQIYRNFTTGTGNNNPPVMSIISDLNISYGRNILLTPNFDTLFTSTPYYNGNSGLVQMFNLSNIILSPSTLTTVNSSYIRSTATTINASANMLYVNGFKALETAYTTTETVTSFNISYYNNNQFTFNNISVISSTTFDRNVISIGSGLNDMTTNINGVVHLARYTGRANPTYMECVSGPVNQYIDFHCNSDTNTDYDARILAFGGNDTTGQGELLIQGKHLVLDCPIYPLYSPVKITSTHIGYIKPGNAVNPDSAGNETIIPSLNYSKSIMYNTLSTGVWYIIFGVYLFNPYPYSDPYIRLSISPTNNEIDEMYTNSFKMSYIEYVASANANRGQSAQVVRIVNVTNSSQTFYGVIRSSYQVSIGYMSLNGTRIA